MIEVMKDYVVQLGCNSDIPPTTPTSHYVRTILISVCGKGLSLGYP